MHWSISSFFFAPARANMKQCTFIAIFAPILLLPLSVMPILHNVHAVTAVATMGDYFLYHYNMITRHVLISHYPFLVVGILQVHETSCISHN